MKNAITIIRLKEYNNSSPLHAANKSSVSRWSHGIHNCKEKIVKTKEYEIQKPLKVPRNKHHQSEFTTNSRSKILKAKTCPSTTILMIYNLVIIPY